MYAAVLPPFKSLYLNHSPNFFKVHPERFVWGKSRLFGRLWFIRQDKTVIVPLAVEVSQVKNRAVGNIRTQNVKIQQNLRDGNAMAGDGDVAV